MEQSFSQRMGFKPLKALQVHSMDDDLRQKLWVNFYYNTYRRADFWSRLWTNFFKEKYISTGLEEKITEKYWRLKWYEVYDFIEFTLNDTDILRQGTETYNLIVRYNSILQEERSAYRIMGGKFVPITSDQEIAEIEEALQNTNQFTQHLDRALELLTDKKSPDYRNSIKESISAVEGICQLIAGDQKATLGDTLRHLDSKISNMHPAIKEAFSKLYGYTSDAQGIRHALLGKSNLDVEDARFMLIACSAFINYLLIKADKAGIKLPQN
jgi:hypothetical protein